MLRPALAASLFLVPAFAAEDGIAVTGVHFWPLGEVTRIAVEVSGDFRFTASRLSAPERIFFDLRGVRQAIGSKRQHAIPIEDGVVRQIRLAENTPGSTRIVLDLDGRSEFIASQLADPPRLMIEVRNLRAPRVISAAPPAAVPAVVEAVAKPVKPAPKPVASPKIAPALVARVTIAAAPPVLNRRAGVPSQKLARVTFPGPPPRRNVVKRADPDAEETEAEAVIAAIPADRLPRVMLDRGDDDSRVGAPAKRGSNSLTRALGLKVRRIVLDAGHGGRDEGTAGSGGLTEKAFVLDVVLRLGALLQERMGSEVIYTRSKDVFVPLERRSEIANQAKADLFLSIHANSSPVKVVSGVETYYLSFSTSRPALEVAARENAGGERSVSELKDLVQKIMLRDRVDESREFASVLQSALFRTSAKMSTAARNRGVKKAPFVVLIGATMPAAYAEIGFVSNARDEAMFKKPEYRQKIAEGLYQGVAQYADSLSHFQVARGIR